MFYWNSEQWNEHIELSKEFWGAKVPVCPNIDKDLISSKSEAKLTYFQLYL